MRRYVLYSACCSIFLGSSALAQDSVSVTGGCPPVSDAVLPWDLREQCNCYIVDLDPFHASKGTEYGIAPIVKSSRTNPAFFNNLISGNGMSRLQRKDVPFACPGYFFWDQPGFGINDDPERNNPGNLIDTQGFRGNQFGVVLSEFGDNYNGVVGAVVNYQRHNPKRLYVKRVNAAANSCDPLTNISQFGVGSVDEFGNVLYRADAFGVLGAGCGFPAIAGNSVFRTNICRRTCDLLNLITGNAASLDATAAMPFQDAANTFTVPNLIPESISGSPPVYIGPDFVTMYRRGNEGGLTIDGSHLNPNVADHRGAIAYTSRTCGFFGADGTAGVSAILGRDDGGNADRISVWGLRPNGDVAAGGPLTLILPAVVTDNDDAWPSNALGNGLLEFDNYHSQTAFRGGVSQIAVGIDLDGNLLVAAQADHPFDTGSDHPFNFIAVARIDCNTGDIRWTMAGHNDDTTGSAGTGKAICDETGAVIGRMVALFHVTGGAPFGPSTSAPAIDSVGNVWFTAAVEVFDPAGGDSTFHIGLLRAIYDSAAFSYKLELVLKTRDVFRGRNSGLRYMITFMGIADNNSIDSGSVFSQAISETAYLNRNRVGLETDSPETLGGMVINAEITYDYDGDGDFDQCTGAGGDPNSLDQDYNVLLYISPVCLCGDANCDGVFDGADIDAFFEALGTPAIWEANHPGCDIECVADINRDGALDGADIDPFFTALGAGRCP